MVDYGEAIKRPFSDVKKLLIGIVIQLIPIVNFMAIGYQLKCANAMEKKFELPEWEEWGNLFVKGLMAIVIGFIYMLPALIVLIVMGFTVITTALSAVQGGVATGQPADISGMLAGMMSIGVIIALVLMLIAAYLLPLALISFVSNDSFGAAFRLGKIFRKAFKVNYIVVWIVMVIYSLVVNLIALFVPYVGSAAGLFITGVTAMTAFGELYPEL